MHGAHRAVIDDCHETVAANNGDWFTSKPNNRPLNTTNSEETEKATTETRRNRDMRFVVKLTFKQQVDKEVI